MCHNPKPWKSIYMYLAIALMIAVRSLWPMEAKAQNVKTYIPPNAVKYLPVLKKEVYSLNPIPTFPEYYPALIEHESCISLKHSRCWSPTSSLKTSREEGAGLGQTTRAYNKDGTLRFDSLNDLRDRHLKELKDLSWSNIYQRPDLQIRSIILMSNDNQKSLWQVKDPLNRYQMADAAYNGGLGHVNKERIQCGLMKSCNPQIWFGNVADIKTVKSLKPLYGDRSAYDINRHHVDDVFNSRMPKYVPLMKDN